jgi:hypothetical protein
MDSAHADLITQAFKGSRKVRELIGRSANGKQGRFWKDI